MSMNRSGPVLLAFASLALGACSPDTADNTAPAQSRPQSQLAIADVSADEGHSGTTPFRFRVTLAPATDREVRVRYRTEAGTAFAGQDFTAANGELVFAPGATEQFVTVAVKGDGTTEADETFSVRLNGAVQADLVDDTATGTIVNDDGLPVVSIAAAAPADEGGGRMLLTVSVEPAATREISVDYATADGTARAPGDYAVASGSLQIQPGATSAQIFVDIQDDAADEHDESFTLALSNPRHATLGNASATITIADDDADILRVGAAKRAVGPSQTHIDGALETRAYADADGNVGEQRQQFGLGGYGLSDPTSAANPTYAHIGNGFATGNYRGVEEDGAPHSTYVRAFVVEQKDGDVVAFVTLDAVGAGNIVQKHLKAAVTAATGIPADNVLFGQTHSHSAADLQGLWGGVPATWLDCDDSAEKQALDGCGENDWSRGLYQLAADAVKQAYDERVPANLVVATGALDKNRRRTLQVTPDQTTDKALTVLQARAPDDGRVIGTIMQYAAHPTILGDDNRLVHSDFVLSGLVRLEREGGTALYYNGPIADAAPAHEGRDCAEGEGRYCNARTYGRDLADHALALLETQPTAVEPVLGVRHASATLPVTNAAFLAAGAARMFNRYYNFVETPVDDVPEVALLRSELPQVAPFATTTVSRVTLGTPASGAGLEIATIPGEGRNALGQLIRYLAYGEDKASKPMMLLGLTHNSFGYIIPEEEFGGAFHQGELYEEVVSLGPLTAPLLRLQAYFPLFDVPPEAYAPAYVTACQETPDSDACMLEILRYRLGAGDESPADAVIAALDDLLDLLAEGCHEYFPVAEFCTVTDELAGALDGGVPPEGGDNADAEMLYAAAEAMGRGCDLLDPSNCLLPFPSDHFTVAAAPGSVQSAERGGTGRRIDFNVAAMPRNAAGKPIDPSEWNRNDGYSPGQQIITYVPGVAVVKDAQGQPTGPIVGAPPITNPGISLDVANSAVLVLDAETGEPHPVWAEIDLNAGYLLPADKIDNPDPTKPAKPALIVRPAKNFAEGRRYVVVLKNLKSDATGEMLAAQTAFRTCRDGIESALPPVQQRCAQLAQNVFPVLESAGIAVAGNASLYLAWDFTTASAENNVGRLRHMRDDAFINVLGQVEDAQGRILNLGRAPTFNVTQVIDSDSEREIRGSFVVPSYVLAPDPSPLEQERDLRDALKAQFPELAPAIDAFDNVPRQAYSVSAPPNRLFYNPTDAPNPEDPLGSRYGDGLPDRTGEMTTTFTCRIPKAGLDAPGTARPIVYGHGLLGGQEERGPDQDYNMMYCKADWYGFAFGDIPNVVSALFDMSNFPVVPDGSQQGMLNQLFLARLLRHPEGFQADPAFRSGDTPLYDTREVFYDGNSQGGILGGPVVALSKDINRGVFGVVGMNYSTLLQRSVDYDGQLAIGIPPYSMPTYLGYQDDLDRQLVFSIIQMLWDRSENNGYAHHLADNSALRGPDNQVLLHPAFADHQVTMWSAEVMARTVGVTLADMYPRKIGESATYTFADKWQFFAERHPDAPDFWGLPLYGRDGAAYDGVCAGGTACRTTTSAFVEFDEGRTAIPPIGNVPPRADEFDPHGWPRGTIFGRCQKSHFLHTQGRVIDVRSDVDVASAAQCPALPEPVTPEPVAIAGDAEIPPFPINPCAPDEIPGIGGSCLLDVPVLGDALEDAWAFVNGGEPPSGDGLPDAGEVEPVVTELAENVQTLPDDLAASAQVIADNAANGTLVERGAEAVVMEGRAFPDWSQPAAQGVSMPYPNGAFIGERDAHAGVMLYPQAGFTGLPTAAPVGEIVAYKRANDAWVEIPVQVDERFPYFLANPNSDFGIYSGTDTELTYAWDRETWKADGHCEVDESSVAPTPDPVPGLDDDDEIAFMARDAGELADPAVAGPEGTVGGGQQVALSDPLNPGAPRYVYLFRKPAGATFSVYYVDYARDANADQFIDRSFFEGGPETDVYKRNALGTSNTGYGPNLSGTVCWDGATPRNSTDRFPRDGVTISTDKYQVYASGRWMIRDVKVAKPGQPRVYGADIVDRWKGRAFQQSPDSTVSLVGFEDEQVNWEANSALLGERVGPVRAIREVWGADSGTNVTKTETYYSDAYSYRYRVRVHPIPPDGLYTSWDYNRGAMVPAAGEDVPGGRYYTAVRGAGVPIDGQNDDVGNVDGVGETPAYFDMADPTLNLPLAMYNWEQVSAKGDLGSLVYMFELKSATIGANAAAVPYYRDDACLDDGTGDDPVQRPWPGESSTDARVRDAYSALAGGTPYEQLACEQKQGAYAQHGVHFFAPPESDNATLPVPANEIDGQQWAFLVPTAAPTNVGERYANLVRAPLVRVVTPRPAAP
jgi:hypothetical protein